MIPRRILHILDTAEPRATAIFNLVANLAHGIDPARYQSEVCFLRPGPLSECLGVPSTCVHWNASATDPRGAARYASLLRSSQFSILHQHTGGRLLTGMGRWLTKARIVRTLHSRAAESTGIVPPHCRLPRRDALIAVSRIVAEFSGDPRAVVVYPGIDVAPCPATPPAHKGVVIGTACRLEPIKGVRYLLEAFAQLIPDFADLRLEIAGDGSLRSSLEEQSRKLGVSHSVCFLGWRHDMASVMANWDIFALPSLDEGFPIAALEAAAAGLPVVATAVGGSCELVEESVTGFLVPVTQPDVLALRLRKLICDGRERAAMGKAGRERTLSEFTLARMVEKTAAVYDGLLSN